MNRSTAVILVAPGTSLGFAAHMLIGYLTTVFQLPMGDIVADETIILIYFLEKYRQVMRVWTELKGFMIE